MCKAGKKPYGLELHRIPFAKQKTEVSYKEEKKEEQCIERKQRNYKK